MALTVPETQEADLAQLRRLAQSPGWELYRARVQRLVQRNEAEKAKFLRTGDTSKAAALQHQVDGLVQALNELYFYMGELTPKDVEQGPSY